jgi:hypothetical protein
MNDPVWLYVFLCGSAFLAGLMNSVAGGGTLLTFPALLAALSPLGASAAAVANATSTVALLPGSFAGALGYRKELAECRSFVVRLIAPSLLGGLLGAWLVWQYQAGFGALVPWLILTSAVLFLIQAPVSRYLKSHRSEGPPGQTTRVVLVLSQFLIAVYGGYFGAGIGILMLTALGFMGIGDIHRMNAVKTILAAFINAASVVVFIPKGLVNWSLAWPMVLAAIAGGYVGARVARRLPTVYVRYAIIVIAFGLAAYYFLRQSR